MQIQLVDTTKRNYDVYIIPTFTDKVMEYPILSTQEQELLAEMVEQKEFTGKAESILSCNIIIIVITINSKAMGRRWPRS